MNTRFLRIGGALSAAAALSLTATPAMADRWGGWHRHHDDVGGIIAGILVIGGIAAVASAASTADRQRRAPEYRYPDTRYPAPRETGRYGTPAPQQDWGSGRNIDRAVDSCVASVERGDRRVQDVDNVRRDGDGWRVEGRLSGGSEFSCSVGDDGSLRGANRDSAYDGTGPDNRPDYPG